jgi:hypothetical protein
VFEERDRLGRWAVRLAPPFPVHQRKRSDFTLKAVFSAGYSATSHYTLMYETID